jgi:hypothetical protein
MSDNTPSFDTSWLREGQGRPPELKWAFHGDDAIVSMALSRESGDVFVCDAASTLYRLTRAGKIAAVTHPRSPLTQLVWSEDGLWGYGIESDKTVVRLDRNLQVDWEFETHDDILCLAVSPFGHHVIITHTDASNVVLNERKRKIARFETVRPLQFAKFCGTEPVLFGAAENGLLCCHNLVGAQLWQERVWSNVGSMSVTGSGDIIYLANFSHGVQAFDGDGTSLGAYVLEGTVDRVATSYEPYRLIAATIEQFVYWLDSDGDLIWSSGAPSGIVDIACDPLGDWALVALDSGDLVKLEWNT